MTLWIEAREGRWGVTGLKLAVLEEGEEKGPPQGVLVAAAAVVLEELMKVKVTAVRQKAGAAAAPRAVQEPQMLEEAAAEGVVIRELVPRTLAVVVEERELREAQAQLKTGPAEEEPEEAAWPWPRACETSAVEAASSQSAAAAPWSSSKPLLRPEEEWEALAPE
jgi:hypothetical protein